MTFGTQSCMNVLLIFCLLVSMLILVSVSSVGSWFITAVNFLLSYCDPSVKWPSSVNILPRYLNSRVCLIVKLLANMNMKWASDLPSFCIRYSDFHILFPHISYRVLCTFVIFPLIRSVH